MIRSFISATRTLTRVPIPGRGATNESNALYWFPILGALIGGTVALLAWLTGGLAGWHTGAGTIGVIASTWITGCLHMDGLGDSVDAIYGGQTRERRLDIMKDVHMGAFGVIAIILSVIVKVIAISRLAAQGEWFWISIPFILSRTSIVILTTMLSYARKEGGKAGAMVANARTRHLITAIGTATILCWLLTGTGGLAALIISCLIILALARWMNRVFGGVTGDLLGMTNEIVECLALFGVALLLPLPQV